MSGTSCETRTRTLAELEQKAFLPPDHQFSLTDLREYAYAKRLNEQPPSTMDDHVGQCSDCQRQLEILERIDPILNGQEDSRLNIVIEAADNPIAAKEVEARAGRAIQHLLTYRRSA